VPLRHPEARQGTFGRGGARATIGNSTGGSNLTNVVAGSTTEFTRRSQLTAAYVGPIRGSSARYFDGAVQLMFKHFFGP